MKYKIMKKFKAKINGVVFENELIFNSCIYILGILEEHFGECYTKIFIKDLMNAVEIVWFNFENVVLSELENEFLDSIIEAGSFKDIKFTYGGDDYKFDFLNKKRRLHIKQG